MDAVSMGSGTERPVYFFQYQPRPGGRGEYGIFIKNRSADIRLRSPTHHQSNAYGTSMRKVGVARILKVALMRCLGEQDRKEK